MTTGTPNERPSPTCLGAADGRRGERDPSHLDVDGTAGSWSAGSGCGRAAQCGLDAAVGGHGRGDGGHGEHAGGGGDAAHQVGRDDGLQEGGAEHHRGAHARPADGGADAETFVGEQGQDGLHGEEGAVPDRRTEREPEQQPVLEDVGGPGPRPVLVRQCLQTRAQLRELLLGESQMCHVYVPLAIRRRRLQVRHRVPQQHVRLPRPWIRQLDRPRGHRVVPLGDPSHLPRRHHLDRAGPLKQPHVVAGAPPREAHPLGDLRDRRRLEAEHGVLDDCARGQNR